MAHAATSYCVRDGVNDLMVTFFIVSDKLPGMHEKGKALTIDISQLEWGKAPVPPLPISLINIWNGEVLPDHIARDCSLASGATISALDSSYWGRNSGVSARVRHFCEFLIKSRFRTFVTEKVVSEPWPVGLAIELIPLPQRAITALRAAGFYEDRKLNDATFGQLISIPGFGIRSLLEIATVIDAAFEVHRRTAEELAKGFSPAGDGLGNSVEVSTDQGSDGTLVAGEGDLEIDRWSSQFQQTLSEVWADQVDEHDPRFRNLLAPGFGTIEQRIERAIADPASVSLEAKALADCLPLLRDAIKVMEAMPIENALLQLLSVCLGGSQPRLDAIAMRLGWKGEPPKTLQECGDLLGVTRERVRQIENKFLERLACRSFYLPQIDAGLAVIEAKAPLPVRNAAMLIMEMGISRVPFAPESLLATAQLFGRKTNLSIDVHKGVRLVVTSEQDGALGIVGRIARNLAGKSGVVSVFQVTDAMARQSVPLEPLKVDEDDVRVFLRGQQGYEFLNEDWFWYTALPDGRNRLENVINKMLSVASPQSVTSLREGIRRLFRWRSATAVRYRFLTVPPQAVLIQFIERHPNFALNGDMVSSVYSLDYRKVLGDGEQALVEVLRNVASGVIDRRTLIRECSAKGINQNTLGIYTSYSPILEHLGIDLWQLRGVRVDPAAIEAVRMQNALRPRESRLQDYGWSSDGKLWITWLVPHVSKSAVFGVPGPIKRFVLGKAFSARPKDMNRPIGKIGVTDEGISYGYGPFLRYVGADEGDILLAEFDLARAVVALSIGDVAELEDQL